MLYQKKYALNNEAELKINNINIKRVQSSSNLGITFNSELSWSNHINSVVGKIHGMLRNLWSVKDSTPLNIRMLLAKTYLIPVLLYGCEIYANCNTTDRRKLNVAFNNIARYIFHKSRRDSISSYSYKIFNMNFNNLLNYKCLLLFHKIIYLKQPEYLYNRLKFARSNRGRKLILTRFKNLVSERQFFIFTPRLWNNLPANIQIISNTLKFKRELLKIYS